MCRVAATDFQKFWWFNRPRTRVRVKKKNKKEKKTDDPSESVVGIDFFMVRSLPTGIVK